MTSRAPLISTVTFDGLTRLEAVRVGGAAVCATSVEWDTETEAGLHSDVIAALQAWMNEPSGRHTRAVVEAADHLVSSDSQWPRSIGTPGWAARMAVAALRNDMLSSGLDDGCRAAITTGTKAAQAGRLTDWVATVAPVVRAGWHGQAAAVAALISEGWRLTVALDAVTLLDAA